MPTATPYSIVLLVWLQQQQLLSCTAPIKQLTTPRVQSADRQTDKSGEGRPHVAPWLHHTMLNSN